MNIINHDTYVQRLSEKLEKYHTICLLDNERENISISYMEESKNNCYITYDMKSRMPVENTIDLTSLVISAIEYKMLYGLVQDEKCKHCIKENYGEEIRTIRKLIGLRNDFHQDMCTCEK